MTALILLAALVRHDGLVIAERAKAQPLAAATVTAYRQEPSSLDEACRSRAKGLARAMTDAGGRFTLGIDGSLQRYFAVYCASGYAARGEWNRNERGSRAAPAPVRLWPAGATSDVDAARRALLDVLDYAAVELNDVKQMDATAHLVAKEGAPPADVRTIELLDSRVVTSTIRRPRPGRASPEAVRAILANAASHARYFWRVAPALFTTAAERLSADEQAAVLWLRNRPRGAAD